MEVVRTFEAVRERARGTVGLVPTMGFLHEGHESLLRSAASAADTSVMTLFVNPLQFDEEADLERYPRDLERDASIAESAGIDVVFAPDVAHMYPRPVETTVAVPALAARLEGEHRPGHFAGVATVVAKLFAGIQPDIAWFGRKDAQQLAIIKRMAADLSFPVFIVGAPIMRETDGLALSSRNVFLDPDERRTALALSRAVLAAGDAVDAGERDTARLEAIAMDVLGDTPGVTPEYATAADQDDVEPLPVIDRPAFLAVAVRVGPVRLIDNIHIDVAPDGAVTVDRGVRLTRPSVLYRDQQEDT